MQVPKQTLIACTECSDLSSDGTDGNFGMAFPFLSEITEITTKQKQSFFQNYIDGHADVAKVFSFYTGSLPGTSPTLTFGGDYQNPNFHVDLSTINSLQVLGSDTVSALLYLRSQQYKSESFNIRMKRTIGKLD